MLLVGVPRVRMCTVVILWVSDLLGGIAAVVALCVPEDAVLCLYTHSESPLGTASTKNVQTVSFSRNEVTAVGLWRYL